ncbi:dnaJ homolog subfamily C member 12 isoform X2 [Strigops habroptila]|uniref:DnaJ homolog subfamily C member 12 n=1 Tax=Strigops habroptila TaxID=2489341 RepID=A0A672U991_STRHB|nr:dnaJ homolog subfamily C member 12 isoform X2 [Strigops habroptila]XP_030342949.1 dnaJ homolog subfamily C member 12 isoform X2 [Strigops habroptila]XP_030342950.1 dnaJ homolog subfamily C member 12 isoform X2 [Strigops habroptila]XP_030342951.1 dnaJ homolog subfamily C member 12 isoform X2 [Strigops habroptila]
MDAILNCRPDDLEDYYNLLGCDELSTVEQILAEFKIKALECHPDKHPGNPKAVENFQKLQQAKEILTNEESRAHYDYWRRSKITIPFQQWEALSNSVKTSMHWAVQNKKDQMLEAPDLNNSNNIASEIWTQKTENDGLSDGNGEQDDVAIPDGKPESSKNPDSPRFSEANYWHLHFRWSGDAPSELLRKFRNYEI